MLLGAIVHFCVQLETIFTFVFQVCSAGSRLLVQETIHDKLIEKIKERMKHLRVGTSLDKCIDIGAIVDPSQKKSVEQFVEEARAEGAEVLNASPISTVIGCNEAYRNVM